MKDKRFREFFKGKKVLVTGGTGTVGSEIVRRLLRYDVDVIRVFSRDEHKQFDLQRRLEDEARAADSLENIRSGRLRFLIGDIRNEKRLHQALREIDVVFHAAAMKRVLSCEYNPFEALQTNVLGTQNLIDVCLAQGVKTFIYTSTDKAVNPSNAMGASKLFAEKLVTSTNYYKGLQGTVFASLRFGNILGSRGSVVPIFHDQIMRGGPITITDPGMTRFVISLEESLDLIFTSAVSAHGGEVFVRKMPVVNVKDLADVVIRLTVPQCGRRTGDIKIRITGADPGEKLHEDIMTAEEAGRALETDELFIVQPQLKQLILDKSKYRGASEYSGPPPGDSGAVKPMTQDEIEKMLIEHTDLFSRNA